MLRPPLCLPIYFFLNAMTASPAIAATPSAIREAHRRDNAAFQNESFVMSRPEECCLKLIMPQAP